MKNREMIADVGAGPCASPGQRATTGGRPYARFLKNCIMTFVLLTIFAGCTVKTVGDPNRPITINANIVVDIRGLKNTATNIEDMVAGGK